MRSATPAAPCAGSATSARRSRGSTARGGLTDGWASCCRGTTTACSRGCTRGPDARRRGGMPTTAMRMTTSRLQALTSTCSANAWRPSAASRPFCGEKRRRSPRLPPQAAPWPPWPARSIGGRRPYSSSAPRRCARRRRDTPRQSSACMPSALGTVWMAFEDVSTQQREPRLAGPPRPHPSEQLSTPRNRGARDQWVRWPLSNRPGPAGGVGPRGGDRQAFGG